MVSLLFNPLYPVKERLVVIPTYNEIENIEAIIRKVFSLSESFDLLIVDDGSPDGTARRVRDLQEEFPPTARPGPMPPAGCTCWNGGAKWGWEPLILTASNGRCPEGTSICSRWMPISRITPKT